MAAVGNHSEVIFSYRDKSGEISKLKLNFIPFDDTADNSPLLGALGDVSVVGTALNLLTDCVEAGSSMSIALDAGAVGLPSNPYAQRELAARMRYQDNVTGKFYRFDIPGPNANLILDGTDDVDMAAINVAAFKVLFDANAKSPVGNAATLLDGRIVGRYS